jgi:Zn-dependent protease/predicted transcriptional regulator
MFRILGIPVRFHFTFLLILAYLVVSGVSGGTSMWTDAAYIASLFASVLLHELGHALTARQFGIGTVEITMYPIGGVARLDRSPKPSEELWVTAAGPLVNLVIAGGLYAWLASAQGIHALTDLLKPTNENLVERIAFANLSLAAFNLIPAFPMDGGRLLRALLALRLPQADATEIASRIGRGLAFLMGVYGVIAGPFTLIIIAIFVWLGASQESQAVSAQELTRGVAVREAMITDFRTLAHGSTIRQAADLLLATSQQDFPVMHGGQVLGLLGRNELLHAMAEHGADSYVSNAMRRDFVQLPPDADLGECLSKINEGSTNCALVMDQESLVGLLTAENLAEFLIIRQIGQRRALGEPA